MNPLKQLLSEITGERGPGANGYRPNSHTFYDVNDSFQSILCDLAHPDEVEIIIKTPIRGDDGLLMARTCGISAAAVEDSRNGKVVRYMLPRLFTYTDPCSRVLQHKGRRANPFFHLYEAIWTLTGSNVVTDLAKFAKQVLAYSDDGETWHGAYGNRWRNHFGGDQLATIINSLKSNPADRRLVLQMWDPRSDLQDFKHSFDPKYTPGWMTVPFHKDVPCNTHAYLQTRKVFENGESDKVTEILLDLTVMNRSNDIIWGMLGSNYVTFSILLEYIAGMTGLKVGFYHHFTANAHIYLDQFPKDLLQGDWHDEEFLDDVVIVPASERIPLVTSPENFDDECKRFVADPLSTKRYQNDFFNAIAVPMMHTHNHLKNKELDLALKQADLICQEDWKAGAINFIESSKLYKSHPALN